MLNLVSTSIKWILDNVFYGTWCSTMWYIFYLIWKEDDFLWLGCLHTGLSASIFSWLLFKATYPKQTCSSSALHSIFQETELFPSSAKLALSLYCLPWYSEASMETQRSYIFTVYRAKNLVRITAGCRMEGERTVFLFLFLLLPCCKSRNTILSVVLAVLGSALPQVNSRRLSEGLSLACGQLWWWNDGGDESCH